MERIGLESADIVGDVIDIAPGGHPQKNEGRPSVHLDRPNPLRGHVRVREDETVGLKCPPDVLHPPDGVRVAVSP